MPNTITPVRPVFAKGHRAVFEVEAEAPISHFTWALVNNSNHVVDRGYQVVEGYQAVVQEAKTDKRKRQDQSPDDTARNYSLTTKVLKEVGGYHLHLYEGDLTEIQSGNQLPLQPDYPLLADDSFFVQENIPGQSGRAGDVLKVRLTQDDHGPGTLPEKMFPSYADFRSAIKGKLGSKGQKFDNPDFGDRSYRSLSKLARQYVGRFDVRDFGDLVPKGYLEDREHDPLHSLPLVNAEGRQRLVGHLPAVELIWNYWQEEGMLVQTLNVILARFQNRRIPGRDPLARFDITPLLPLRNKLWGFAEGEMHRLTVRRRAAEYEFEYGLSMQGRAIPPRRSNVERRSAFLEAFHQVLHLAHSFYKEFDDLTVQADAFPLYRALRDCHLVLSQGTENQYGEMAVAARAEFLVMQAILAEPQMREFLGGRPMTPYPEPWMDRVDSMKSIQGWTDTSVMHFHDLATLGEQLVLSIRLGNWAATNVDQTHALTWAQAFRSAVQKYAAAYRSVTGVDLAREPNAEQPSVLISRKASGQQLRA